MWRFRRKVHNCWLIAGASIGVIFGVVASLVYPISSIGWLLTGISLISLGFFKRNLAILPLIIIGGVIVGMWRGGIERVNIEAFESLTGSKVEIIGRVSGDPSPVRSGISLVIADALVDGQKVPGRVWVSVPETATLRGDIVRLRGAISEGFGSFAFAVHRAEVLGVARPEPGDVARQIRDRFADAVRSAISEPQAALGIGFLLGQQNTMPQEFEDTLRTVGLTHIIVASGYNLMILVGASRRLFEKVSSYLSTALPLALILGFIALTGMSASMSRAGLVAGMGLLAWYYGRVFHPLVLLPLAAAITLIANPFYAWGDVGWLLSFAAFFGVLVLAPLLHKYFFGDKRVGMIRQISVDTLAAQLCTLPIIVLTFGTVSNVALIVNVLVVPFMPIAMLLTFAAGIVALFVPAVAGLAGFPAQAVLNYMSTIAESAARLPWAQSEMTIGIVGIIAMYAALIAVCVYMAKKTKHSFRREHQTS